tara:strand:+ start:2310 stop:3971 length:1662 start_codon:yes stop_codon:yes gene_type:complete
MFLTHVWNHLHLPAPTPIQQDIATYLEDGPRRLVIEAFRGIGKSYITSAYCCYCLLKDPEKKILVVSASKIRSDDFSTFTQRLILEMPVLQHLRSKDHQRHSKISFDVGPSTPAHAPSVKSVGISGQMAGSRADLIIADDVEVPNNSMTQGMRDRIAESVKEFDAILKPSGRIIFLGTPQSEQTLYELLPERGYELKIWCARVPDEKLKVRYGVRLSDYIQNHKGEVGDPTDPLRFDKRDLEERELSYGRAGFSLQFMLDTSLSDADKYPLKLQDLVVMDIPAEKGPQEVIAGKLNHTKLSDLPNVGLAGDGWYGPLDLPSGWEEYTGSVMSIDPSGRGKDETAYAIVKMLNGNLYLCKAGGFQGGYSDDTMTTLATLAKAYKVNLIITESNFGDGMFSELLKPHLRKIYPVDVEEIRSTTQKERRIIDTLEPVMMQHRLIIDPKVINEDYISTRDYSAEDSMRKMLLYQMTRITRDRGSLRHDDRLDALALAIGYWVEQIGTDQNVETNRQREEALDMELEKFIDGVNINIGTYSNTIDEPKYTFIKPINYY